MWKRPVPLHIPVRKISFAGRRFKYDVRTGKQVDARSNGDVAQLGEHLPCKQGVRSSILLISTNSNNFTHISHFFSVLRTDVRDDVEEKANCTQTCLNLKSI